MNPTLNDSFPAPAAGEQAIAPDGNTPRLRFLRSKEPTRPSNYPIYSLERALAQAGVAAVPSWMTCPDTLAANLVYKFRWMWNLRRSPAGPVFVPYMSYMEKKTFPFSYWTEIIPYTFDCWPATYDWWASFYRRERIRLAFISARQSVAHFAREFPCMTVRWLPEAIDPSEYSASRPLAERDIDVLEMGRRHESYHDRITAGLARSGRTHVYDRAGEKSAFSTRADLVNGLARTRILVCFPRSVTHPESARGVETVTYRYFQALASGCLIVGHAPQELIDLFGYNPVIEAQAGDEHAQLEWLLADLNAHAVLIERNYSRLLKVGTWSARVRTILDTIRNHPAFAHA